MAAATAAFLSRVGVEEGWRCLDVGCGDGQVTLELARTVGRAGRAEGIDLGEDALAIAARQRRAGLGLSSSAPARPSRPSETRSTSPTPGCCSAICRTPWGRCVRCATPSGRRVGGGRGPVHRHPALGAAGPALDRLQEVYSATVRGHGGDPTIGPRLPVLLGVAGLDQVSEATVENPMTTVEDKLFLAELVDNMRDAMVASGAATAAELDELRADVERAARDPERVFHQAGSTRSGGGGRADPMPDEDLERVRRTFDAINQRDFETLIELTDPEVIAIPRLLAVEGGVLQGHDGVRTWWRKLSPSSRTSRRPSSTWSRSAAPPSATCCSVGTEARATRRSSTRSGSHSGAPEGPSGGRASSTAPRR